MSGDKTDNDLTIDPRSMKMGDIMYEMAITIRKMQENPGMSNKYIDRMEHLRRELNRKEDLLYK